MPAAHLENLRLAVAALDRPVLSALVAGIDAAEVRARLGDDAPPSVVDWFGWCNCVLSARDQKNDDVAMIPGYAPVSLEEGVSMRSSYEGDPVLSPQWSPLLAGPSGDIYAAVWSAGEDARVAGVLVGEPTEIEFSSIEEMVTVFVSCIAHGAFFVDDEGLWSIDAEAYDEVYAQVTSGGA